MDPESPSPHPVRTVMFVCPHGAAKSVLAGSYFNLFAAQLGLEARAIARGTDPDAEIPERVRRDVGPSLCAEQPTRLTTDDIANSDFVVAFDLAEPELGVSPDRAWNELPALSADFDLGRAAILGRVVALIAELNSRSQRDDQNANP